MKTGIVAFALLSLVSVSGFAKAIKHDPKQCPMINGTYDPEGSSRGDEKVEVKTVSTGSGLTMEFIGLEDGFEKPAQLNGKTVALDDEGSVKRYRTAYCAHNKVIIDLKRTQKGTSFTQRFTFFMNEKGNLVAENRDLSNKSAAYSVNFVARDKNGDRQPASR